jgi:hypothetical protein
MLIKCAFVGQKTLIFIEMHGTTTTKKKSKICIRNCWTEDEHHMLD